MRSDIAVPIELEMRTRWNIVQSRLDFTCENLKLYAHRPKSQTKRKQKTAGTQRTVCYIEGDVGAADGSCKLLRQGNSRRAWR